MRASLSNRSANIWQLIRSLRHAAAAITPMLESTSAKTAILRASTAITDCGAGRAENQPVTPSNPANDRPLEN